MPPVHTGLSKRSRDSDNESTYDSDDSVASDVSEEQPLQALGKRHKASGTQPHQEVDSVVLSELNNGCVRTVKRDGRWHFCVRDVIQVVCDVNNDDAGKIQRRVANSDKLSELENFQFPGARQRAQPVATFDDIQKLIMVLPGKSAKKYRTMVVETFKRYLAGDEELVDEIRENATSSNPLNVFAREDMEADRGAKVSDLAYRERLAAVEKMERENEKMDRENECGQHQLLLVYEHHLKENETQQTDPTMKRMNADFYKNMVKGKQMQLARIMPSATTPAAVIADVPPERLRVPISDIFQSIARRRPRRDELMKLGRLASKKYREQNEMREPPKIEQFVDGATRMVNCYNLEEHPWLVRVVDDFLAC